MANVSPIGKVIDYYSSELPNNGWTITYAVSGTEVLASNGSYDLLSHGNVSINVSNSIERCG